MICPALISNLLDHEEQRPKRDISHPEHNRTKHKIPDEDKPRDEAQEISSRCT